ncbi:MAG: hypothetical protein ABJG56_18490 [Lentilitoribacter sp.]
MKRLLSIGLAMACLALPTSVFADDYKAIKSESQFKELVIGKKLWLKNNHFTAKANGKVVGNFNGNRMKGSWVWRDGYWCRTLTTHSQNTDCQKWETNGSDFRVSREKGSGTSFIYTLKK